MIAAWVIILQLATCNLPLTDAVRLFWFLKQPCQKTLVAVKMLLIKDQIIDLRGRNLVGKNTETLISYHLILWAMFISQIKSISKCKMQPAEGIWTPA